MSRYHRIIEKPLITEKSMELLHEANRVSFRVHKNANKLQVKKAIEEIFEVTVEDVNMVSVRGKQRRFGKNMGQTKDWKKAIVRLKQGDKIELFEGV